MVVRVNIDELRRSAEDFSRSIGIPEDVDTFIKEFLEISGKSQRDAAIFLLETKMQQIDFTLAVIDKIINKKFIDLVRPFLNQKLRKTMIDSFEAAVAKIKQAKKALESQIARLKKGERIEVIFVVEKG